MPALSDNRVHHWWHQRHLLWEFLRRDLQGRYVGSAMGFFWSVINPLILLALYWAVFGLILKIRAPERMGDTGRAGFALYIFCGLVPWYAIQEALVRSTTCVVDNAHLIRQVRFPAKVLPAYLIVSSIVNQLFATAVLLLGLVFLGDGIQFSVIMLPFALIVQAAICFGLGLLLATLHTYLRDVAPLVTVALMACMWMTPLFYSVEMAEASGLGHLILANPFAHLVMLYQEIFLMPGMPAAGHWVVLCLFAAVVCWVGYKAFTGAHDEFADVL